MPDTEYLNYYLDEGAGRVEAEGEGGKTLSVFSIPAFYLCLVNLILPTDPYVQVIERRTFLSVVCLYPAPFCLICIFKANANVTAIESSIVNYC